MNRTVHTSNVDWLKVGQYSIDISFWNNRLEFESQLAHTPSKARC